jgi:hypothetical protein
MVHQLPAKVLGQDLTPVPANATTTARPDIKNQVAVAAMRKKNTAPAVQVAINVLKKQL